MNALAAIVSLVAAVLSFFTLRSSLRNAQLKRKLRRALRDCLALYALEELYCHEIVEAYGNTRSHLSVKRAMRFKLRARKVETPSSDCTPQRINEELEKLS